MKIDAARASHPHLARARAMTRRRRPPGEPPYHWLDPRAPGPKHYVLSPPTRILYGGEFLSPEEVQRRAAEMIMCMDSPLSPWCHAVVRLNGKEKKL